jgi:mannose-6-phosphate isomerase-like protein (cupin superfamily)
MTMDAKGFVVLPGQAPVLAMSTQGRSAALMLQSEATAESVMMFEETVPAGTAGGPLHLHRDSDEVMYVLSGEITCKIGDRVTVGGPGTCAFIPRGVAHAWKNTGGETARILFMYTPAGAGKWFEERSRSPGAWASMDDRERAEFFERHGWENVGPPPFE